MMNTSVMETDEKIKMETDERITTEGDKNNHIELEIPLALLQYLSSEECNLQNICRVCLSTSSDVMYPLSSTKEFNDLAQMFHAMTSIHVNLEDDLPSSICSNCQSEVVYYYKFRTKCAKADYMLKSILKGEFSIKEESKLDDVEIIIEKEDLKSEEIEDKSELNDYPDDLKSVLSEDESLCIVQNTLKNEKKYTIYDRDSSSLLSEVIVSRTKRKKKSKHECSICFKVFHQLKLLRAHQNKYHATTVDDLFPCEECKERFNSENDLKLHSIQHRKGPWTCTICDKDFIGRAALRRHIRRHMDSKRFTCEACGKTFVEKYALKRHSRVHTGEQPEKKHICPDCGKRFIDNGQLMAHMSRHNGKKPFQCALCDKAFPSPRLLTSHRLIHSDLKPYACNYCDKRFRHDSTRNTHHRTHTGEKPYVCSICGKTFIQNSNLRLHMRTHTGEKPYACSRCDSKFSSGSTLKSHMRTHTGERPFKCKVCGKSFARLNLKLHMRLHSGEKPFACSACPKKYVSASHLRDHCRTHTGEKPFECAKCESKFSSKALLIKHLKTFEINKSNRKHCKDINVPKRPPKNKNVKPVEEIQNEVVTVPMQQIEGIPNAIVELTLGTHETFDVSQELVFQDNNVKTHVIVLGSSNTVSFLSNDVGGASGLNIVTVNEIGVSMSATNANF